MERSSDGVHRPLEVDAWHAPPTELEAELIADLPAPVLDIGCGPGRIAAALAAQGVPSLGIDVAPAALDAADRAGATVLDRSVFDQLPGEGRWGSVLLLDGNVGIGGDPVRLLSRARELLRPDGVALLDVEAPGCATQTDHVRLRCPSRGAGPWFRWAWVGADDIAGLAAEVGFGRAEVFVRAGRHLARLVADGRS
ncbi:methyltransferase domain-containing protein [Dermatobacter hominis]|uniref:methyltransferase domain-containing protein n=1 Tax=Dermatobacter hominis TaxID=2884263 RepID=UPI001D0FCA45|nr:methyltransferase domain-containing protein [Dermatobacter hominis]UDY34930.1 class I SAM-dependent methyltransferase [Dermatobacter hominis]